MECEVRRETFQSIINTLCAQIPIKLSPFPIAKMMKFPYFCRPS